jgi:hypothetical protein
MKKRPLTQALIVTKRVAQAQKIQKICNKIIPFKEPVMGSAQSLMKYMQDSDLDEFLIRPDMQYKFVKSYITEFQLFVLDSGCLNDPAVMSAHVANMKQKLAHEFGFARVQHWPEMAIGMVFHHEWSHLADFPDIRTEFIEQLKDKFVDFTRWTVTNSETYQTQLQAVNFQRFRAEKLREFNQKQDYIHRAMRCAEVYMRYSLLLRVGVWIKKLKSQHVIVLNNDKTFKLLLNDPSGNMFEFRDATHQSLELNADVICIVEALVHKCGRFYPFIRDILAMCYECKTELSS